MSQTINITTLIELASRVTPVIGDKNTPVAVLVTNGQVVAVEDFVLADNYTAATLWATGQGGVSTFTWGVIISNVDTVIQLKNDLGTAEYTVALQPANVPYFFGSTTRGRTSNSITTTVHTTGLGNVNQIIVQNNNADTVGDGLVSCYLFN